MLLLYVYTFKIHSFPSVTFSRYRSSSVTLSKAANWAFDKELILVAIVSASGMTRFPQSNHSLDTFNTSHRLMIVPKEGPYGVRKEYYDVEKPFGTVTQVHIYLECLLM